jgi:hypothetical protein
MPVAFIIAGTLALSPVRQIDFAISSSTVESTPIQNDSGANDEQVPTPVRHQLPIARGFGKDIPLSFAARQVVPRQFHLEFGPDVDRAIRVSWQGGRPWPLVLHDMAAPLGLHFNTHAGTVHISK